MTSVDGCNNDCGQCNDVCEIERLRSLITAWVDAEDLHYHYCESVECGICFRDTSKDPQTLQQACDSLRKAVGR